MLPSALALEFFVFGVLGGRLLELVRKSPLLEEASFSFALRVYDVSPERLSLSAVLLLVDRD